MFTLFSGTLLNVCAVMILFVSEYVFAVICISMGMCAFLCEQCVCVFYFTFYGLMRSYIISTD